MYTIRCGNINGDDVMFYAIDHENYSQKFQFDYGYNWARYNKVKGINETIETNNDHFLNGIRCAVKNGLVDPKNINILFYHDLENHKNHCTRIMVDKNGRLDNWPDGFFDQYDISLNILLEDFLEDK